MGQSVTKQLECFCGEAEDEAVLERTETLQKGATFLRKTMMGNTPPLV
jgi:hypothetical protein